MNLTPENQSRLGDIFVPNLKAGKPASFDVTVTSLLQSNSLTYAATKAEYVLDATDEQKFCIDDSNCVKMGIFLFPLQWKSLAEYRQHSKKVLKTWLC